jgi:hypothetical protein
MNGTSRYVLIAQAAALTGYSRAAIEAKIAKGQWVEGREWVKAPDGHRMIDMEGYARWVQQGNADRRERRADGEPV